MKKATLLIPVLVLSLAFTAFAQERPVQTGGAGKDETVKLMVNGWANVYWALTNGDLNESSGWAAGGLPAGSDENDTNSGLVAELSLRFGVTLQDKVDVVVELRTRDTDGDFGVDGTNYLGGSNTGGTADPTVRQGYIQVGELIGAEWTTRLGLQPVKFDVRGRGNALFLDSDNAESAFDAVAIGGFDDDITGVIRVWPETLRDELVPAGITFAFKREKLGIQFGAVEMVPAESGGDFNLTNDESLYFVDFTYDLDDQGSKFGGILALMKAGENNSSVWTLGGAVSHKGLGQKGMEVFAEAYFQTGTAYDDPNATPGAANDDVDVGGWLLNGGVRFEFESQGQPWIEASILYVTGADTPNNGGGTLDATEDETDEFFSYEGNDDLLIVEDHVVGLDIDNNYWTVRAKAGTTFQTGAGKNNLKAEVKIAVITLVEEVRVGTNTEDAMGWEFDAGFTYVLNKNASVYLSGGWLTGADVLELFTAEKEDSAFALKLGTWVNW